MEDPNTRAVCRFDCTVKPDSELSVLVVTTPVESRTQSNRATGQRGTQEPQNPSRLTLRGGVAVCRCGQHLNEVLSPCAPKAEMQSPVLATKIHRALKARIELQQTRPFLLADRKVLDIHPTDARAPATAAQMCRRSKPHGRELLRPSCGVCIQRIVTRLHGWTWETMLRRANCESV